MTTTMTDRIRALAAAMLTHLMSLSERPLAHLLGLPAERNHAWVRQARQNVHDFATIHLDTLTDPELDMDWLEILAATASDESWTDYCRQFSQWSDQGITIVTDQAELDQAVKIGARKIEIRSDGPEWIVVRGDAKVYAYGESTVLALDNAKVYARDNATVYGYDKARVYAFDKATVKAHDNAKLERR